MSPALKLTHDTPSVTAPVAGFADAMSTLASGVVLVTCWLGDRPWGMTVTAFASVSAAPPTVLVSLGSGTATARAIERTRYFGVSILAAEQLDVARHGSTPGEAKFLEPFVEARGTRRTSPVVAGALTHLDCALSEAIRAADHVVLVGRVRAVRAPRPGEPLLYHRRAYRTLDGCYVERPNERNARCLSS